jgi:hypothetical protein
VSRVDSIDLGALRDRLTHALNRKAEGSLYIWALGSCYLCCSEPEEEERLEALYYSQAREEGIDGDDTLSAIVMASRAFGGVVSRPLEIRTLVDEASRLLAMIDVQLGADDYDQRDVERQLLSALNLTLRALELLRRGRT